ncbi:hypothetical protein BHM03_00019440 [Ensete ventricosum]|nr:hypothetical protein BHM03_00019440 [Ensete ventricosum]
MALQRSRCKLANSLKFLLPRSASYLHSHATSFGTTDHNGLLTSDAGFKEVREEEKSKLVGNVFSSVASNYDLMNDLMSIGLHRLWKDRLGHLHIDLLVTKLCPFPGMKHLDVAGGTVQFPRVGFAEDRYLHWVEGDAEALSFEDESMDGYTIGFGIRNVTHIEKALAEAYR